MAKHQVAREIVIPTIIGVAASLVPWLLERAEIATPVWVVAGLGGVTILALWYALLWPLEWLFQKITLPNPRNLLSTTVVSVCGAIGLTMWFGATFPHNQTKHESRETAVRLQFLGGTVPPTEVYVKNIYHWYTLWSPSAALSWQDANRKQIKGETIVPVNWVIFIVFQQPTNYKEVSVFFSSPGFPQYEVKSATDRFVIVDVSGEIPAGYLEVYLKM
jgi:hypothetical protein